jgi:hypothetical protein
MLEAILAEGCGELPEAGRSDSVGAIMAEVEALSMGAGGKGHDQ